MAELDTPINWKDHVLHYVRLVIATIVKFILKSYYGDPGVTIPPIKDEILKKSAVEVARQIRNKEITSVEVIEACIRRIKDVNTEINCFVQDRYDTALKEAREADELIRSESTTAEQLEKDQPFLGVPFTTKDCMAVKGLHFTSGVYQRKDIVADRDADVIRLLREKGAIIIGLTNVPELCQWFESSNLIFGRSKNPYNTSRTVGGSSGGEGGLQAVAGSIFGVGSDIGGSIRIPSLFNGIFGHKPSRNIVSVDGQWPENDSALLDSFLGIGPMCRHAEDLKPLLKIMAGPNSSKLNLDKPVDLGKIKVYYQFSAHAPMTDSVDPDITAAMKKALEHLKSKYNVYAEEKKIQRLQRQFDIWYMSLIEQTTYEDRLMIQRGYFSILKELCKTMIGCSQTTFIGIAQALVYKTGFKFGSEEYNQNLKVRDQLEKTFVDFLGDDGVFLYPTHATPAPYHHEPIVNLTNFGYTGIFNSLGLPSTHVPMGLGQQGMPIGFQVVSNYNNDRFNIAVAEELGKAFGGWVEPKKS